MKQHSRSYLELPCDRCGSIRVETLSKDEEVKTTFGSSKIKSTIIMCTNIPCQGEFEKQRAIELVAINTRKLERENRAKERQASTAKAIASRKEFKFGR